MRLTIIFPEIKSVELFLLLSKIARQQKKKRFSNGMQHVRTEGPPALFVTFTCNPKWTEISECLSPNETPSDRPDLVVRVFRFKLETLIEFIDKKEIFSKCKAYMGSVEFQKRGLPHAHIVVFLDAPDMPNTPAQINEVINAKLSCDSPDPMTRQIHGEVIEKHMIHICKPGRCGNDGCSKGFPMNFEEESFFNAHRGKFIYKRPNDGASVTI